MIMPCLKRYPAATSRFHPRDRCSLQASIETGGFLSTASWFDWGSIRLAGHSVFADNPLIPEGETDASATILGRDPPEPWRWP